MHSWAEQDQPLRLVQQPVAKTDKNPKALACYGLLVRLREQAFGEVHEQVWLRFVDGRPVSPITVQCLEWCCGQLEALGKTALLLVWDRAPWHISKEVRGWIQEHNRRVKEGGQGVKLLPCPLPSKSPWLNPIEPKWVHGKRKVAEPDGVLSAEELERRICECFGCSQQDHLSIPEHVA
ncbi:MAG: transposase [Chloroflexota bacterium]|nr:transposase [Chloroflexota bacterium]